jgi:WD40 repeat protein
MKKQFFSSLLLLFLCIMIFYQPVPSHASDHTPLWTYTFPRYQGGTDVVISANGQYFAVIGAYLHLFKYDKNVPLWRFEPPFENMNSVAMSADGQYIVLGTGGSFGGHVYLFSKDSSTPLWISTINMGFPSVKITPDGRYIVAGGLQNITYLFDRRSPTPILNYSVNYECSSVAISAAGQYIAVGTGDYIWHAEIGALYLFSNSSSTPIWNYTFPGTPWSRTIRELAISADGQYLASRGTSHYIYLFNRTGPPPVWNFSLFFYGAYGMTLSTKGTYLAILGRNEVFLLNRTSPTPLWNYTFQNWRVQEIERTLDMSADGQYLAAARYNLTVIFNRTSAIPLWNYITPYDAYGLAMSADGNYIVLITYGEKAYGNTVYLFHLTQRGPTPLPLDPLFLYILGVVGVFLACQFGLYRYLSRIGWEENRKDRVIYATIVLSQGVLAGIFMTDISIYDRTSYWVLSLYLYIFLIFGSIILILNTLKKTSFPKQSNVSRTGMIISFIFLIIIITAFLTLYQIGYSTSGYPNISTLYFIVFFGHLPIYYDWLYFKAKRKGRLQHTLPPDPLKLTVSEI